MPELVASGEGFEGPFVDYGPFGKWGLRERDKIAPPELEAEGVAEDFFFVEKVGLRRVELSWNRRHSRV